MEFTITIKKSPSLIIEPQWHWQVSHLNFVVSDYAYTKKSAIRQAKRCAKSWADEKKETLSAESHKVYF